MFNWLHNIWPFSLLFYRKLNPINLYPLVPTFKPPASVQVEGYIYNPEYYATEDCAETVMRKFNAQVRYEKPVQDSDRSAPPQWFVRFPDGLEVNAGQLAKFFALYPEKDSKTAIHLGINLIGMLRQEKEFDRQKALNQ